MTESDVPVPASPSEPEPTPSPGVEGIGLDEDSRKAIAEALAGSGFKPKTQQQMNDERNKRVRTFVADLVGYTKETEELRAAVNDPKFMIDGKRIDRALVIALRNDLNFLKGQVEKNSARNILGRIEAFDTGRNAAVTLLKVTINSVSHENPALAGLLTAVAQKVESIKAPWIPRAAEPKPTENPDVHA